MEFQYSVENSPVEDNLGDEPDGIFHYSISGYGEECSAFSLVELIRCGNIVLPSLERGYLWDMKQASRLIESLLIDLPVPPIYLARDRVTRKLVVLDGQRRLRTIQYFYDNRFIDGRDFALKGVHPYFEGATYISLSRKDRLHLDQAVIQAFVVTQEEPSDDLDSLFQIFERLNTFGTPLKHQEMRTTLYRGPLIELIKDLNKNEYWRSIYGPIDTYMKDQELIARFFAFYFSAETYQRPMRTFLNSYIGGNRHFQKQEPEQLKPLFEDTIETLYTCVGERACRVDDVFNAALFDAVMVGVARRLSQGPIQNGAQIHTAYHNLLRHGAFTTAIRTKTALEKHVALRLDAATSAFAEVE